MREGLAMDYRNIDCGNRPDPVAFARDWDRTVITAITPLDPLLAAIATSLNRNHVNGGAAIAQFRVEAAAAVAWVLTRNRLNKLDFFPRFFGNAAVIAALPEAAEPNDDIGCFEPVSVETSSEQLQACVTRHGAYRLFAGSDKDAARLVRDAMHAVCGAHFEELTAWVNRGAWSGWFHDIAWDHTFFWFDARTGVVTVLLITDCD